MTLVEIILTITSMLTLIGVIYTNEVTRLFARPIVVELVKIENDDNRQNFYHGRLDDGRLVQVRCRYGYVEILRSVSKKQKNVCKCVFSKYFESRKHTCKMGFDDAIYFLKKGGFNVKYTQLIYKHERRT